MTSELKWQYPTDWSFETVDGIYYGEQRGKQNRWYLYFKGKFIDSFKSVEHAQAYAQKTANNAGDKGRMTMDKEREAFEARYRPHWTDAMFRRSYDNDEDYADTDVDLMWQGWQARAALDNPAPQWLPIESAPRDDKPVLLYHKTHGEIRGWFAKGEWSTHYESGREYSGDAWVLGDDIEQVLVEQMPDGSWCDGEITHWMPLPQPPQGDTK